MSTTAPENPAVFNDDPDPVYHLTTKQWAVRSGLPYDQIRRARSTGALKSRRLGDHQRAPYYISAKDFLTWLDSILVTVEVEADDGDSGTSDDDFLLE